LRTGNQNVYAHLCPIYSRVSPALYVNFYCTKCKFGNTLFRAEGFEFGRLFVCAMTQAGGALAGPITSGGKGLWRAKPPKVNLCHLQLAKCETPPGERETRQRTDTWEMGQEISLAKSVPQWAPRAKFRTGNFHFKPRPRAKIFCTQSLRHNSFLSSLSSVVIVELFSAKTLWRQKKIVPPKVPQVAAGVGF
jgi:hypothetical protein